MDIWDEMYNSAKELYHPTDITPFIYGHSMVCAIESENGEIFTGFCIESISGVMNLCAERVAALNMYASSGQTVVKRIIAFKEDPLRVFMPCGSCREFFLQLSAKNKDIEFMVDYEKRETVTLEELIPNWWGWDRYNSN